MHKIIHSDCLDAMRKMEDNSIDFVVCDPPYFLTNNSGSGFMGKSWDSIHGLSKYLWESNTFVNSAINLLSYCMIELNTEEASIALPIASMQLSEKTKKNLLNAQLAQTNLLLQNVQLKDSADLLVLTKLEAWDLLRELSPSHTQTVDKYLNGVSESVVFAMPIILLVKELNNIVLKNVLQKPKVKDIEAREILLSLMDQAVLKNAIEGMIGTRLESLSTNEINGHVNTASSIAKEKKFNVITLSHIEREDLITWITSLLCVINAIRSSNTIQNYLIQNFYKQIFKECLRIVKPGSMIAVFGGTRTVHRLTCGIEDAGFEVRDVCMFLYGSGFPKSHNFGRKLGGEWKGFGTALKPAYEPIIIAMKPLDGTFAQNAEKWGVGGINIDDSRIGTTREVPASLSKNKNGIGIIRNQSGQNGELNPNKGRWPANLILDEESSEELDRMTGVLKSGSLNKGHKQGSNSKIFQTSNKNKIINQNYGNDSGGASRFFYCAKASSSERNKGLDEMLDGQITDGRKAISDRPYLRKETIRKNTHPTVKPISLMKYIITLLAPPGNPVCLDPFMGSGSTGVACQELGINFIGIEKEKEYVEIAKNRIKSVKSEIQLSFI